MTGTGFFLGRCLLLIIRGVKTRSFKNKPAAAAYQSFYFLPAFGTFGQRFGGD